MIFKKTAAAARFLHLTVFGAGMAFTPPGTRTAITRRLNCLRRGGDSGGRRLLAGLRTVPGSFTTANKVETFSSDGPRRILYNANSTPITPGNVSSTGGVLRQKPDITAADGMLTGAGLPIPFSGTSAAAPHAAAIAGLLKSGMSGGDAGADTHPLTTIRSRHRSGRC